MIRTPETQGLRREYIEASTLKRDLENRVDRAQETLVDRTRRGMDRQLIEKATDELSEAEKALSAVRTRSNDTWNEWLDKSEYHGPWRR